MGYWAKNGAYMHDDDDIRTMEAMNETQGQAYDRLHRNTGDLSPFSKKEKEKREEAYAKHVEEKAKWYAGHREYLKQEKEKEEEKNRKEAQKKAYKQAENRYSCLRPSKKLWLKITGHSIDNYGTHTDVETLNSLYRGKR